MAPQGQIVGYVRVSSSDQHAARQLDAIGKVDRIFEDQVSGGSRVDRSGLAACLAYVRAGDVLRVASMDRLARSLTDLQQIVDEVLDKGAAVEFVKERQTYAAGQGDSMGRLLLQLLGAFAEFERALIKERQAEGIRLAKAAGRYAGRRPSLTDEQVAAAREQVRQGVPKTRIAAALGVDRSTLYRALAVDKADV
jgi:DNA invertase Pin-like site-specific DNA recombinase